MARGDGATTRQMKAAPKGAHFVWVNGQLGYPKDLARKLGRDDLVIVSPDFFVGGRWQGIRFTAIVVDHAAILGEKAREGLHYASFSVRQ